MSPCYSQSLSCLIVHNFTSTSSNKRMCNIYINIVILRKEHILSNVFPCEVAPNLKDICLFNCI